MGNEYVMQKRQRWAEVDTEEWEQDEAKKIISNPLVLLLTLSENDHGNLPYIENDEELVRNTLVNRLNYTICPSDKLSSKFKNKKYWSKKDIINFLETSRYYLYSNADKDEIQHDSVILYFAGYGNKGHIYSSDKKAVKIRTIQDKFGESWKTTARNITKIFIFGCGCDDAHLKDQMLYEVEELDQQSVSLSFYSNDPSLITDAFFKAIEDDKSTNATTLIADMNVELKKNDRILAPFPKPVTIELLDVEPTRCKIKILTENDKVNGMEYEIKYIINNDEEIGEIFLRVDADENEISIPNLLEGTEYLLCARQFSAEQIPSDYGNQICVKTKLSARSRMHNFVNNHQNSFGICIFIVIMICVVIVLCYYVYSVHDQRDWIALNKRKSYWSAILI